MNKQRTKRSLLNKKQIRTIWILPVAIDLILFSIMFLSDTMDYAGKMKDDLCMLGFMLFNPISILVYLSAALLVRYQTRAWGFAWTTFFLLKISAYCLFILLMLAMAHGGASKADEGDLLFLLVMAAECAALIATFYLTYKCTSPIYNVKNDNAPPK